MRYSYFYCAHQPNARQPAPVFQFRTVTSLSENGRSENKFTTLTYMPLNETYWNLSGHIHIPFDLKQNLCLLHRSQNRYWMWHKIDWLGLVKTNCIQRRPCTISNSHWMKIWHYWRELFPGNIECDAKKSCIHWSLTWQRPWILHRSSLASCDEDVFMSNVKKISKFDHIFISRANEKH